MISLQRVYRMILQRKNDWLTFGWCAAHRLELAIKDGLGGTPWDAVDEVILRLYYLYKKSPKKTSTTARTSAY